MQGFLMRGLKTILKEIADAFLNADFMNGKLLRNGQSIGPSNNGCTVLQRAQSINSVYVCRKLGLEWW